MDLAGQSYPITETVDRRVPDDGAQGREISVDGVPDVACIGLCLFDDEPAWYTNE